MNVVGLQRESQKSAANRSISMLVDRLGGTYVRRDQVVPLGTDLVVQWGFKPTTALCNAIKRGIPYVIVDLGYFFQRTTRFSVSFNGFHGTSVRDPLVGRRKMRTGPSVSPWREEGEGDRVLVIGQMPNDQSLRGQDIDAWMGRAAIAAAEAFGLPVHKRPHPKMLNPWEPKPVPIGDALGDCAVCVTWTSTVAIESVVRGVPTVAMHKGNMAFDMAAQDMRIVRPEGREEWVHELSWREWDWNSPQDLDTLADYIRTEMYPVMQASALDHPRNQL